MKVEEIVVGHDSSVRLRSYVRRILSYTYEISMPSLATSSPLKSSLLFTEVRLQQL